MDNKLISVFLTISCTGMLTDPNVTAQKNSETISCHYDGHRVSSNNLLVKPIERFYIPKGRGLCKRKHACVNGVSLS